MSALGSTTADGEDLNRDGVVDSTDQSIYTEWAGATDELGTLTRGDGDTHPHSGHRTGYASYEHSFFDDEVMHVRHRVYLAELGRWTRRDPAGYVDGMNLYAYVQGNPIMGLDPMGLFNYVRPLQGFNPDAPRNLRTNPWDEGCVGCTLRSVPDMDAFIEEEQEERLRLRDWYEDNCPMPLFNRQGSAQACDDFADCTIRDADGMDPECTEAAREAAAAACKRHFQKENDDVDWGDLDDIDRLIDGMKRSARDTGRGVGSSCNHRSFDRLEGWRDCLYKEVVKKCGGGCAEAYVPWLIGNSLKGTDESESDRQRRRRFVGALGVAGCIEDCHVTQTTTELTVLCISGCVAAAHPAIPTWATCVACAVGAGAGCTIGWWID